MLIDHAKIYVTGGRGGKGCQSMYKDLYNRRGTPDGGDGGHGGDVIIESCPNLHTLLDFRYNQHHSADKGKHGGSNRKFGKSGIDLILKVPVGTVIIDADTGLVVRDLVSVGESVVVAKGGEGGKGSAKLLEATDGDLGVFRTLLLELKLVADAGLIGFPNAGKSTLISRVTKAHSKIAPYPFTTKSPKLGVVKYFEETFVMADMPGLIEGAHAGRGLGDRFLRHIERTMVLVHVVDMSPVDESCPVDNYFKLEKELELYGENVYDKPRVIVANKMDISESDENLKKFTDTVKEKIWPVSAVTGQGIEELLTAIHKQIRDVKNEIEEDNDKSRNQSSYQRPEPNRQEDN